MTIVGYARVSSTGQTLDIQIGKLSAMGCERIYQEKLSGSTAERTQYKACMDYLREGDRLVITKLDRLARSVFDLASLARRFKTEGISLHVIDQNIDTATPSGKLLFNMLAVIAEFENDLRRERQLEGIVRARQKNVKFGRPSSLTREMELTLINDKQSGMSMRELQQKYGISAASIYRTLARHSENSQAPEDSI